MNHKVGRYGWKKPSPELIESLKSSPVRYSDEVVKKYSGVMPVGILPSAVDLRPQCPPVYDQFDLGSCTANAGAGAIQFDLMKQKLPVFTPSRLFIYFNERDMDGDVMQDAGSSLSTCVSVLAKQGVCPETEWPYDITKFTVRPPTQCYMDGVKTLAIQYSKVANQIIPSVMKLCLSEGDPFIFGFTVFESFESEQVAQTGIVPMPQTDSTGKITESVVGGHAVMCVGYDDSKEMFLVRNSWGSSWGIGGYFWIPYKYLTNSELANDFWCIKVIS